LILGAAIFLTDNLHSLPSHIGEFFESVLLLPAALVFVLLRVPGDFLSWLSGVPDWLLSTVQTVDAYFYSLVLTIPFWIIMRLKRRIDSKRTI
jgi:hypothetical protein